MSEAASIIEIEGLTHTYHDGSEALRGIDLTVEAGEKVGVVGPNGAGKSTLLLHLNGTLHAHTHGHGHDGVGAVRVFGLDMSGENLPEVRRRVGLVFQDPEDQLFMPTVFDDVAFGPLQMGLGEEEVRARVAEALEKVGLTGYDKKSPHHLSYGEKRSVAIATVLSMTPSLIVLDEPSSNLDPRGRRGLIEFLQGLEQTQIIATHDLELVLEVCGRCIVLDGGKVIADGPTAELLADASLMEAHGLEVPASLRAAS